MFSFYKEIKLVNPKGNQPWIFIGRANAEAGAPTLWPSDAKSRLTGKDPDAEKDSAGGEGDDRGWDGWIASPTQWTWDWANSGGAVKDTGAWCAAVHGVAKSWTWLSDRTTTLFSFYREDWTVSLFQVTRAVVSSSGQWTMRKSKKHQSRSSLLFLLLSSRPAINFAQERNKLLQH